MSTLPGWNERQLRFVSKSAINTLLGALTPATVFFFYLHSDGNDSLKYWYITICVLNIFRLLFTVSIQRRLQAEKKMDHKLYLRLYASVSLVSSSAWVYLSFVVLPNASLDVVALLTIIYAGITAGFIVVNLVYKKLVIATTLILLVPFIAGTLMSAVNFSTGVSVLALSYLIVMFKIATQVHDAFYQQHILLVKNQELALDNQRKESSLVMAAHFSSLGKMAGEIAHEINNPVAILQGYSKKLATTAEQGSLTRDMALEIHDKIDSTIKRLVKIIRGMRKTARYGALDEKNICQLRELTEETLAICSERFRSQNVKLNYENSTEEIWVNVQSVQISQVLLNLLNNSVDAVASLDEKWIEVCITDDPDNVQVAITDSGAGISDDVRDKIMTPFFTTKGVGKGSGLGLSLSEKIMRNHNGYLKLDDGCVNTRFVIGLPKVDGLTESDHLSMS